jgi:integrase
MAGKRMNGDGSIYQRKFDGLWFGAVVMGDERGEPKRKTVSATTKESARQKLKRLMEDQERLQAEGLPPIDNTATVSQVPDRWHKVIVTTRRETTAINYRYVIDWHLAGFVLPEGRTLGSKKLARLTFGDVDALLEAKREAGLAPSTTRLIRSVLVQAINQVVKWRVVTRNEAAMSTPVSIPRSASRSIMAAQARRLMSALKDLPMGSLFMLILVTGMRRGEALGLRWEDVDLKKGVISIRQQLQRIDGELKATEVKTDKSRRSINLSKSMVQVLKAQSRSSQGTLRYGMTPPTSSPVTLARPSILGTWPRGSFRLAVRRKSEHGNHMSDVTLRRRSCWQMAFRSKWCPTSSAMPQFALRAMSTDMSLLLNGRRQRKRWQAFSLLRNWPVPRGQTRRQMRLEMLLARHSAASIMFAQRVHLEVVSEVLGHSSRHSCAW